VTTDELAAAATGLRAREHPKCVVCSPSNESGLKLNFTCCGNGCVQADFNCDSRLQGYEGRLHGGILASVLDGAMTNCMFARGAADVTAELTVRFLSPVQTQASATVRAWVHKSSRHLNILRGEVVQGDEVKATAVGKFMKPVSSPGALRSEECRSPQVPGT
jgi:uncharacterized protein (TIGR00369 family)